MSPQVEVLGVRHHGPGSARAVLDALDALDPDVVLVEGPSDADPLLAFAASSDLAPPVALFAYVTDAPAHSAFWPFAVFSPEWQAIRWAAEHDVPVRFCDLPAQVTLAERRERAEREDSEGAEDEKPESRDDDSGEDAANDHGSRADGAEEARADAVRADHADDAHAHDPTGPLAVRFDPIGALAHAAGYDDAENWWEDVVESRPGELSRFAAITEAMAELRAVVATEERPGGREPGATADSTETANRPAPVVDPATAPDLREARREAHMRQQLRAALKAGAERVAVVCGAWHAPALTAPLPPASADAKLLRGLPKAKTSLTWVPWTHSRLASSSGYGAGIESPGWYHHLFTSADPRRGSSPRTDMVAHWHTRVAGVLREEDLPVSSAHVIEAARLTDALATLRGRPTPGLAEVSEAALSVMCDGDPFLLDLVTSRLVVGEAMGDVPDDVPAVPLETDLLAVSKRLRLKREALPRTLDLDLRSDLDGHRSRLLHRLRLLDVPWAEPAASTRKSMGTFRETWELAWRPELAIAVVEASLWGTTVETAAVARLRDLAATGEDLGVLAGAVNTALRAGLPDAIGDLLDAIGARAAVSSDVGQLMSALPALVHTARYGDVRGTDTAAVGRVVHGLLVRVCLGLGPASVGIDVEAARELARSLDAVHAAVNLYDDEESRDLWFGTLVTVAGREDTAPSIAGWVVRALRDAGRFDHAEAAARVRWALSRGADAADKATWVEGFLGSSGELLVHDLQLLRLLDEWVSTLGADDFVTVLPLLRRTLGTFDAPVRRTLGEQVRRLNPAAENSPPAAATATGNGDNDRGERGMSAVAMLLGMGRK